MKFFEDMGVGERYEIGSYAFTVENIKSFAQRFDPQPFHVDEEAGARSPFGALIASGWQTVTAWMPLMVAYRNRKMDEARARGEEAVAVGPAPGMTDLKWIKPVYAGDTISYATEVTALRRMNSRPKWGVATLLSTGHNQRGELVLSFVSASFIPCRSEKT